MKIVADKDIPYLKGVLEPFAEVVYLAGTAISHEQLWDADALLTRTRTRIDKQLLEDTPVKFVGTATIGYDHIDTAYCDKQGIVWKNAPGCNANSVNQYVASSLAILARRHNFEMEDRAIGIVGVGNVGSKVVKTAELLGMHVYLCDPPRADKEGNCQFIELEGILRECDIITFHVPLTLHGPYKTHHLIDTYLLSRLNPGTFLLNTSRGPVADTSALISSIRSGDCAGLAMDVWEGEPDISRALLEVVDIATPHIAGYSADGKANATAMILQAVDAFFGFGLDGKFMPDLPLPVKPDIQIDCHGMTESAILSSAILGTYDVMEDDGRLRAEPQNFEHLRSNYPLRREFQAYTLYLKNSWTEIERRCRKLGFKVKVV